MGSFLIFYHPLVVKEDIPRLDKVSALRIRSAIETKLVIHPELYGLPLRATLKKLWKLRVGDWRIVYEIKDDKVYIFTIAHRSEVYEVAEKRRIRK